MHKMNSFVMGKIVLYQQSTLILPFINSETTGIDILPDKQFLNGTKQ